MDSYLIYIKPNGKSKWNRKVSLYKCKKCGKTVEIEDTLVRTKRRIDCGNHVKERLKEIKTKNVSHSKKVYNTWIGIRSRCTNTNYEHYDRYGGRGIKVCKRWDKFNNFLEDMGEPPTSKHQIDRIDNNGDYEPNNCRWATPSENCNNRSRYNNATGFTGVKKNKCNTYSSSFFVNRKSIYVGSYSTPDEAYKERVKAIKKYNKTNNTNLKYIEYEDYIKDIV